MLLVIRLLIAIALLVGAVFTLTKPLPRGQWLYWLAIPLIGAGALELFSVVTAHGALTQEGTALMRILIAAALSSAGALYLRSARLHAQRSPADADA